MTSCGVLGEDAVVDDALDQQRGDHDQAGVDDGEGQEDGDQAGGAGRANASTRRTVPRSSLLLTMLRSVRMWRHT